MASISAPRGRAGGVHRLRPGGRRHRSAVDAVRLARVDEARVGQGPGRRRSSVTEPGTGMVPTSVSVDDRRPWNGCPDRRRCRLRPGATSRSEGRGSRDPIGGLGPIVSSDMGKRPQRVDRGCSVSGGATPAARGAGFRAEGDPAAGRSLSSERTRPEARNAAAQNAPDPDAHRARSRAGTRSWSSPSIPWSQRTRSIPLGVPRRLGARPRIAEGAVRPGPGFASLTSCVPRPRCRWPPRGWRGGSASRASRGSGGAPPPATSGPGRPSPRWTGTTPA